MKRSVENKRAGHFYVVSLRILIFLALGVGSFLSPHFWRVVFLALFAAYTAGSVRLIDQSEAVDMIRRYRHRYANHLQIISGWLELEKFSRAERYLSEHALSSVQPGVFQGLPLRWVYRMMALDATAEAAGAEIRWESPENNPGTYTMLWKLSAVLKEVIPAASGVITVTFVHGGFRVQAGGIKSRPQKHIIGVRWQQERDGLDAFWGARQ